MKKFLLKLVLLPFLFTCILLSQNNQIPLNYPVSRTGFDTLSKFYLLDKFRKQNINNSYTKRNADKILDLITDPRVVYSSYLGGNGYDCGYGIAVDSKDNIYVVGYTGSTDFPTTEGCYQKEKKGGHDGFIAKFSPNGDSLLWCTYYGGNGTDVIQGCVVDREDHLIVVGKTDSPDLPVSDYDHYHHQGSADAFITKFYEDGTKIIWGTYFGTSGFDTGESIALMQNGYDVIVTGYTNGTGLPMKGLPIYSTLQGNADIYVARFDYDGLLLWSTYFGGFQNDISTSIAVDKSDNIAITGYTKGIISTPSMPNYPTTPDAFQRDTAQNEDAILTIFDQDGRLKYSTIYGGHGIWYKDEGKDISNGVAFDNDGNVYICGYTTSKDFPTTPDAYKPNYDSPDAFIVKFDGGGYRVWSSYFGGKEGIEIIESISINLNNELWLTGETSSADYPIIGTPINSKFPFATPGGILLVKMTTNCLIFFSDYYGGPLLFAYSIISINNKFYFTGENGGYRFPYTSNALQKSNEDTNQQPYISFLVVIDFTRTDYQETYYKEKLFVIKNNNGSYFRIINGTNKSIDRITIYDIQGNIILNLNDYLSEHELNIVFSEFSSGLYFLEFNLAKETIYYKIIK